MNSAMPIDPGAGAKPPRAGSREGWLAAILPALGALLWLAGLGNRPLGEPDEGRYAEVAREMFSSGDWLTPRLDGFHFFDKPVLHYWVTALFYSVFGVHEWTARLWVTLTALLAVAVSGWASGRLYGRSTGLLTAGVLGSNLLFFAGARINTLDMDVAAFLSIAIGFFMVAQFDPTAIRHRTRLNLLGWESLALATLSKGLIGLVFPAMAIVVFMLWERRTAILRQLDIGWGLLLALAIAAPWYIAICVKHPDFFGYFFIREHFGRFLTDVDDRGQPVWFFAAVTLLGLFPWVVFLPFTPAGWKRLAAGGPAERFLIGWVVVVLVFFSASHSKLPFYILPIFPALAMLIAKRMAVLGSQALIARFMVMALLATALAMVAMTWTAAARHLSQTTDLHALLRWFAGGLAVLALLGALAAAALMLGARRQPVLLLMALCALCVWQVLFACAGQGADELSARPVAELMRPWMRPDTQVFSVRAYQRGLSFYLQRLVTIVDEHPADIVPGVASRPGGFVPHIRDFEKRWSAAPHALAVVAPDVLVRLRQDGLPMRVVGVAHAGVVIARTPLPDVLGH